MPWARVGDEWWCHPKVMGVGLAPRGLWVSALSWSCAQRKDVVPVGFLAMVGATETDVQPLVDAGLWVPVDGGWRIHDWREYQEATVSEKRAEAGRKGGRASGKARRTGAQNEANVKQNEVASEANGEAGPIPSLPNPSISTPVEAFVPPAVVSIAAAKSAIGREPTRPTGEKNTG